MQTNNVVMRAKAKNQNDYEIQGKELFLSGQACPNGSSWQQAHIASLKAQALAEPISSIRYYRLADKVSKLKAKHRMLFSSN